MSAAASQANTDLPEGKEAKAAEANAAGERPQQPNGVHDAKNGSARPPPDPNGRPPPPGGPPYSYPGPHPSHGGRYPPPPQGHYPPPGHPGGPAGTPTLNSLLQNRPPGPENGRMPGPHPQGSYGGYPPPQQGAWGGGDPYYRHPHVSTTMNLIIF